MGLEGLSASAWHPSWAGEVPARRYPVVDGEVWYRPPEGESVWPPVADWDWGHWAHWLGQQGWGAPEIDWYRWARVAYGVRVTVNGEVREAYAPLPVQVGLHAHGAKYVLFGGAAGGTKSHALRWDFYMRGLQLGGYRGLIMRRTMPELRDNHIERVPGDMARLGCAGLGVDSEGYLRLPVFAKGAVASVLRFGHCQNDGDEMKYLGPEYDWFGPDEGVTFKPKQVTGVMGRLRSTLPGVRAVMRAGTNPGGIEPHWWVEHFITKLVDRTRERRYRPEWYAYVPARLYDNPYLMDPDGTYTEYIASLDVADPVRVQQLLEGDWEVSVGQYFKEWRAARHGVGVYPIPASVVRVAGLDWGYLRPGVWLLAACLPDGRVVVEDEYVFRETIAAEVAAEIRRRVATRGVKVRWTAADPAMWIRDGQTGESIAETFQRTGVPLIKAHHERVNGAQRVRAWLRNAPDERPWLGVMGEACPYLMRTMPALVQDPTRPEDVDTDGEDHGYDALRYLLMSRPHPGGTAGKAAPPVGSLAWFDARAKRQARRPLARVS